MKKNRLWIVIAIFIIAAIIIRVLFFSKNSDIKTAGATAGKRGGAVLLSGIIVKETGLDEIIYSSGTIMANEEVILHPETSGRIIHLSIKEGTKVNKGDLLVKINDSDLQAQLRKLNSQLKLLTEKGTRQEALLKISGISQEAYDEALNQVSSLNADIDFTRSQIQKTEIRAPFSGQIGLRYVSEGSTVTPNDMIATIRQLNPVKIDFSVPEKYSGLIAAGDSIRFTVSGMNEVFNGKIFATEPGIDAGTRTFRLRAVSDNSNGRLYPGAFARIELLLSKNQRALMVPTQSVIPVLKGKKVFIVQNGKAISVPVETGIRNDKQIEVTSGIHTGDTVITTGIMQLRDSMAVDVSIKN
jgi:membrane fusion protein, multidrug efflux system